MSTNKQLTLLFPLRANEVLLGYKKRGFGKGWWNGFGGKVHLNESVEDAAKRELKEESGLVAHTLDKVGLITFEFLNDPQLLDVHVFRTHDYSGTPTESDEMKPKWFASADIPFDTMWPDDYLWYPLMLDGKYFDAYFLFEGLHKVLDYKITEK